MVVLSRGSAGRLGRPPSTTTVHANPPRYRLAAVCAQASGQDRLRRPCGGITMGTSLSLCWLLLLSANALWRRLAATCKLLFGWSLLFSLSRMYPLFPPLAR